MRRRRVRIFAAMPTRIDVNGYFGQARLCVEQGMAHVLADPVTFAGWQVLLNGDVGERLRKSYA